MKPIFQEAIVMTNRREFLQTGMSVSAWPLALNELLRSGTASARIAQDSIPVHKAVFDDRYVEGRTFADAIAGFGVPASALDNGDVTALWDELDRLWRGATATIAGSTQYGPMFALERLANERGMCVVLRVEHEARADGTLAHLVTGPSETVAMAAHRRTAPGLAREAVIAAEDARCAAMIGSAAAAETAKRRAAADSANESANVAAARAATATAADTERARETESRRATAAANPSSLTMADVCVAEPTSAVHGAHT